MHQFMEPTTLLNKKGFYVFESDMKLIFPDLSKTNRRVVITNYFQLESLVNSAYQNNVLMRLKKINDTPREFLSLSGIKDPENDRWRRIRKNRIKAVEIDINGLSSVKKIYKEDKLVVVEGGIKVSELNKQLKPHGLMFPVPLSHGQTIMEVINENLLLANSYKSGSVKNHIEDVVLMTPSSKLIKTGNRTGDDFCYGYHLKDLIVGSNYSLGFIVECILKLKEITPYGVLITIKLEKEWEDDYLEILKNIRRIDGHQNIINSIRLYNINTYQDLEEGSKSSDHKLLVFYSYSNTIEKKEAALKELKSIMQKEVKWKNNLKAIEFDYDDYKYVNLTKQELRTSNFIDCYVPLSKVQLILNELPELAVTPYEVHLIDNSALMRIYTDNKTPEWLDIVTSKVLRHKGVLCSKKEILDKADPNLITRIVGYENEIIQKEIKKVFDDKNLLERDGLFDVHKLSLVERIKNRHPIYNYLLSWLNL